MKRAVLLLAASLVVVSALRAGAPPAGHYAWEAGGLQIALDLETAGSYRATYSGCLGNYGVVKGLSVGHDSLLILSPDSDPTGKGSAREYALIQLRVTTKDGDCLMVRTEDEGDEMTRRLQHTDRHELTKRFFTRDLRTDRRSRAVLPL